MPSKSVDRFLLGSPVLMGDNTVPGLELPEELKKLIPDIVKACREWGLDFYDTVVQMLAYDEMAEVCSYGGFPVRWPHWKWGMEYEEFQRGYEYSMHRVYEIVINTNPCYIYCLDSNSLLDNVTVIAHAIGHNDFFKNNMYFKNTDQNMMNELANHGSRIKRYMAGRNEEVMEFMDHCISLETLVDPSKAWETRKIKDIQYMDKREYVHPSRILYDDKNRDYMEDWINPKEWMQKQKDDIAAKQLAKEIGIVNESTRDIMGYLRDNAPLKPWQQDIIAMMHEESLYFAPQRTTKMLNEGWASYTDHTIMAVQGYVGLGQDSHDCGIIEYAKHKAGVLGGKYSMNPYALGYALFTDIKDRWDKGKFGHEYESCKSMQEKENWNKNLGLGKEKIFQVRENYNDFSAINEFFTEEFCRKMEFFEWKKYPNGEYKITSKDYKDIKKNLLKRYANGGLPDIRLEDPNHKGKGYFFMQHHWIGSTLEPRFTKYTLQSIQKLWKRPVLLASRDFTGTQEIIYYCVGQGDEMVGSMTREDYESGKLNI